MPFRMVSHRYRILVYYTIEYLNRMRILLNANYTIHCSDGRDIMVEI